MTKPLKVGDKIWVSMRDGEIVDAVVKAVLDQYTDGTRYQVDFGNEQTALIHAWQIVINQGWRTNPSGMKTTKLSNKSVGYLWRTHETHASKSIRGPS
jgi:hypothetical protein